MTRCRRARPRRRRPPTAVPPARRPTIPTPRRPRAGHPNRAAAPLRARIPLQGRGPARRRMPPAVLRRPASGSMTTTFAPASAAIAVAARPIIPAPATSTVVPSSGTRDAASRAATAVAVAHAAGAARAAGIASGTRTIDVPARTCTCVANPPESSHPRASRSCPYLASERHFCGIPAAAPVAVAAAGRDAPHDAVADRQGEPSVATTPPVASATTRPTCSWPSTSGVAAERSPRTVCTSEPQTVASSTSTSASPSCRSTPGTAIAWCGRPGLAPHHRDGRRAQPDLVIADRSV